METLIRHSLNILHNEDNIQVAYDWMDSGDVINEKLRFNRHLRDMECILANKLTDIIKRVELDDYIVLYRGTRETFNPIIAGKQFNAMAPNLETAKTYGDHIIKVIVPIGSNAFYISAWELINTQVEEQEEKEVLLGPGRFVWYGEEDGITTYVYNS